MRQILSSLLLALTLFLALLPSICAIASDTHADWDPATLDYCAANFGTDATALNAPCREAQILNRLNVSVPAYAVGATAVMYMKFATTDRLNSTVNYTSTAVFYPIVDDYSQLTIPGSWPALIANTTDSKSPQISLDLLYRGTIYSLDYRRWATLDRATHLYVPSRTAIITLDNGELTRFEWFSTACTLSTCTCLDSICTEPCPGNNCDVTVYVAWAGTDGNGDELTSSQRDIWRFQNAF
ncbi:hypothetical protein DFJ77DRAFT_116253 [Powellomyces hirtus]|nr:hypothetical protein DFJ77DRAFT_116253 [Powellomyces hirtus]